ncbi:MAG: 5-(carboxyamino)imidazole ribonucleotide synthase [Actinomycetaceae bacterium]|nr:5-(carboxyamino)imidazole ribonucleotide synthase [Actinomycetaceae bacterium]
MSEKIAVIGGGQLARMMVAPAVALNLDMHVLVEDDHSSAAQVTPKRLVGSPKDLAAMQKIAQDCAVMTFEHEHIPAHVLEALGEKVDIHPSPQALIHAQDKAVMRRRLNQIQAPQPRWKLAHSLQQVEEFGNDVGWPIIAKTPTGGYDGKGVQVVSAASEVAPWIEQGPVLVEEKVDFDRELAVLLARSPGGEVAHWPVVETKQENGVCSQVLAPAPNLAPALSERAQEVGTMIANALGVTGVLAVEMFERDGHILVNELAMRPHNCGHWTIEGAVTSQFEQHLRAVLDLPLGDTTARAGCWVMQNLLGCDAPEATAGRRAALTRVPQAHVHLYGKEVRPGRKLGHVTVGAKDFETAIDLAQEATGILKRGGR